MFVAYDFWHERSNRQLNQEAFKKLRLGSSAKLAVLGVGAVCDHVRKETGYSIRVLYEPEPDDPAHSGIHDTAADEMVIAELIAEAVEETHPVK